MDNPFLFEQSANTRVALLTKHDKGQLVAPVLTPLNLSVFETHGFDTDLLGSFSGEIERTNSPVECARKKAQLACELSGAEYGIGSEGSFGGGPLPGIVNWNTEILVLLHAASQREIVASFETSVAIRAIGDKDPESLEDELQRFGEAQAWIIKSPHELHKGILGVEKIKHLIVQTKEAGVAEQEIILEPDLRALYCPERQANIIRAAEQLAERLQSHCPNCHYPDFWDAKPKPGLPCEVCEMPTEVAKHYQVHCKECGHTAINLNELQFASPAQCQWCNP